MTDGAGILPDAGLLKGEQHVGTTHTHHCHWRDENNLFAFANPRTMGVNDIVIRPTEQEM